MVSRSNLLPSSIMELFGLLWQILVFVIVKIFDKVAYVVDDIMFNLEDYEVYDKVVKVRSFKQYS